MFSSLSNSVVDTINRAKEKSKENGINKLGTEYLLWSMFMDKNTICHFLFSEYAISEEMLIPDYHIIRGSEDGVTLKLLEVLDKAKMIAKGFKSDLVFDEHFFLALLEVKGTIAISILMDLELDILELRNDCLDIFDLNNEEENKYTINISKKAKAGLLSPFIGRMDYIERMNCILKRKSKGNPLLIGQAGVGKTAIVEGLASYYDLLDEPYQIISLDLGSCLAGAKYRGDFEERILGAVKEIEDNPNAILFIDEVHNLIGAGQSEGSMDASNLLKPILARGTIRCIGATTIEEYHRFIETDKALRRRFQPIFVVEPNEEEVKKILLGIKEYYEEYHQSQIDNSIIPYLVDEAKYRLPNRCFPDKAIDILDECLTKAKIKNISVDKGLIDEVIDQMNGIKANPDNLRDSLKKYALMKSLHLPKKTLGNFLYRGGNDDYQILKDELIQGFGLSSEMILEIDLDNYKEGFQKSTLIGSPPGYVGYENGGILSTHLKNYPGALISLINFDKASGDIKIFFYNMMTSGKVTDNRGTIYLLNNVIFLIKGNDERNRSVGFFNNHHEAFVFDEIINGSKANHCDIIKSLKDKGYNVFLNDDIKEDKMINAVIDLVTNYPKGDYEVKMASDNYLILKV